MASKPKPQKISDPHPGLTDSVVSQLAQEYLGYQELIQMQPPLVQRFLETQASSMAEAVIQGLPQVRFTLPDRVVLQKQEKQIRPGTGGREQTTGGLMDRLARTDLRTALTAPGRARAILRALGFSQCNRTRLVSIWCAI
jgi:hypothetical protein